MKVIKVFENVMSQNVVTISYYNIYVTDSKLVFIPLDKGIFQELSKYSGLPLLSIGSVVVGDIQRRKMIKALRDADVVDLMKLTQAIIMPKKDFNPRMGLTKGNFDLNGKTVRIKKKIAREILNNQ